MFPAAWPLPVEARCLREKENRLGKRRTGPLLGWSAPPASADTGGSWAGLCGRGRHGPRPGRPIAALRPESNIPVNLVDAPELCAFPQLNGSSTASLTTGGKSPTIASCLRRRLKGRIHGRTGEILDWLAENVLRALPQAKSALSCFRAQPLSQWSKASRYRKENASCRRGESKIRYNEFRKSKGHGLENSSRMRAAM